jgi:hypothetical protein
VRDKLQKIIQGIQINVTGMQEVQGKRDQNRNPKLSRESPPSSTIKNFVRGSQINKAAMRGMQGKARIGHEIDQRIHGRVGGTKESPSTVLVYLGSTGRNRRDSRESSFFMKWKFGTRGLKVVFSRRNWSSVKVSGYIASLWHRPEVPE